MKSIIISLLTALMVIFPAAVSAQSGSWEIYPAYSVPKKMIDTPAYVFILSQNSLVGMDKETNEFINFDTTNRLNSNKIHNAWYSPADGILFVAHTNGMIDLVYDDGRTVNIADLTNTTIDYGTINDVDFRDGKAYIALSKGIIVIDMRRAMIDHVGLYLQAGTGYARIAATDSKVIAVFDVNGRILIADRNGNLSANIFRVTNNNLYRNNDNDLGEIYGLDGDKFLTVGSSYDNLELSVTTIDPTAENGPTAVSSPVKLGPNCFASRLQPAKDGFVGNNNSQIFYVNRQGELTKTIDFTIPNFANTSMILTNADENQSDAFWFADANGVGRRSPDGTFVIPQERPAATNSTNVGNIVESPDGSIIVSTAGINHGTSYAFGVPICINKLAGKQLSYIPYSPNSTYTIAVNPKNPDELVIGAFNGLLRYNMATNESKFYNASNSILTPSSKAYMITDVCFDNMGNLFMIQNVASNADPVHITMVSADGWNNGAPLSAWSSVELPGFYPKHSSRIVYSHQGYIIASGGKQIVIINTKNLSNLDSASPIVINLDTDSDGGTIDGYEKYALHFSPLNNLLWIGADTGVLYFNNIDKLSNASKPSRPKISRNDGTDLADYLLNNVFVNCIHSDSNQNLYIGTKGSGLYRVSPDGTEIIEHLTADNSDLPSDNVLAVYADPNSNKVYVGTDLGLAVYYSGSTPARRDFDDVYAYPNPVTPDYTGHITVTGLMADSLVKITDSAGRVVFEGRSDGGSVVWNGCDGSGSRVKSGVYFVFASSSASGSSQAAVTKIVVVN